MRDWAKARGNRVLHLGGGVRSNDELYDFKRGFYPHSRPVLSWRNVVDLDLYAAEVAAWERQHQRAADDLGGYFPAYRKVP
jgi:hypothetical protein